MNGIMIPSRFAYRAKHLFSSVLVKIKSRTKDERATRWLARHSTWDTSKFSLLVASIRIFGSGLECNATNMLTLSSRYPVFKLASRCRFICRSILSLMSCIYASFCVTCTACARQHSHDIRFNNGWGWMVYEKSIIVCVVLIHWLSACLEGMNTKIESARK